MACALEGDIKAALTELDRALEVRLSGAGEPAASARAAVTRRTAAIAAESHAAACAFAREVAARWADEPISVGRLMAELRDAVPPGTRIVDDCWSASAVLRRTIPFSTLGEYQRSRHGGSIGGGLPMALGVKLAAPESPVVCVSGDGSAAWSIQALWNAAHDGLPVTFVILANRCYRLVRLMKGRLLGVGAAHARHRLCLPSSTSARSPRASGSPPGGGPGELRAALSRRSAPAPPFCWRSSSTHRCEAAGIVGAPDRGGGSWPSPAAGRGIAWPRSAHAALVQRLA